MRLTVQVVAILFPIFNFHKEVLTALNSVICFDMSNVFLLALLVSLSMVSYGEPGMRGPRNRTGFANTSGCQDQNPFFVAEILKYQGVAVETRNYGSGNFPFHKEVNADQQLIINLNILNDQNTGTVADGMRVRFNNIYSAAVTSEDIIKIANFSENLASLRENTLLIVEKRPEIVLHDTVFLSVTNTTSDRNYQFEINGLDIPSNISAFLQDNYLGQQSPINLSGTTLINFNTSSDPASYVVGRFNVILANSAPTIKFSGNVFLQGAYNAANSNMNNVLNSSGILQVNAASQPYNNLIYNYAGGESVAPDFFAAHTNIVDWVLVELRNANDPSIVLSRRAAFVRQDGTLCEVDGSTPAITFAGVPAGSYYVSVRHRNHLGIRSSSAVDFSSGAGSFDFTVQSNRSFQNMGYTSTVQTGNVWSMRGGNGNSDNAVKYNGPDNDQNQVLNIKLAGSISAILNNAYAPEDINMDGIVKWNGPENDQNFLLNYICGGLLSTIFQEQL